MSNKSKIEWIKSAKELLKDQKRDGSIWQLSGHTTIIENLLEILEDSMKRGDRLEKALNHYHFSSHPIDFNSSCDGCIEIGNLAQEALKGPTREFPKELNQ